LIGQVGSNNTTTMATPTWQNRQGQAAVVGVGVSGRQVVVVTTLLMLSFFAEYYFIRCHYITLYVIATSLRIDILIE